jgi:bifunctional oligoribonuclease and PAP phosphatase NrnA
MPIDWSPLVERIQTCQTFLLMTHVRPDADGMGAQLALAEGLRALGKTVRVVIASPLPSRYKFLDPDGTAIEEFTLPGDGFRNVDCILILDTGTWNQIGDFGPFMKSMTVPKAVIDHHRTQDDLGAVRYVDIHAEATGRLIYDLLQALKVPLSKYMADMLLLALGHDTGWFRHPNTTPETFTLAEELVRAGAVPALLYEQLFECATLARYKLLSVALSRLQVRANGLIAFTEITMSDFPATGSVPGDTESLIDYPRSIDGVEVALVFVEQKEGGVKVSFRSRSRIDVSKIAEAFNGGGHKLASGARDPRPLPEAREAVIAAVEAALSQVVNGG